MTTTKPGVQRYDATGCPEQICRVDTMHESDDGEYVLYGDYEALQAECEKLRKDANRIMRLDPGTELFLLPRPPAKVETKPAYRCHACKAEAPPPEAFKLYVKCLSCGELTAATIAEDLAQPAKAQVPEGWHISRTEGGDIIVQKSHVAGFVASEQSGGIAESTLYYLADDLLTASPAPDHIADVRKMVAPDVSELEKAAQKLWRESYNCESDFIQAVVDAFSKQEEESNDRNICHYCAHTKNDLGWFQVLLSDDDVRALLRFRDECHDDGTFTLRSDQTRRFCGMGIMQWRGRAGYSLTSIGEEVLSRAEVLHDNQ